MSLVDASGMPIRMPVQGQVDSIRNEVHVAFQVLQQIRMELLNQALKTQFLIKKLSEQDMLPETLNDEFQVFVKEELQRMQEASGQIADAEAIESAESASIV